MRPQQVTRQPIMEPAIVRPDHLGRTHPDPRADPPTQVLDPASVRTVQLQQVVVDTDPFPVVVPGVVPWGRAENPDRVPGDDGDAADDGGDRRGDGRSDRGGAVALALSSLLGSLAGLLSWLVAARIMPPIAVGDAQLVVSAFLLVGGAAQLGAGAGLIRWLPAAGGHTGRLVWSALLLIVLMAGLVGLVHGLVTPRVTAIVGGGASPAPGLLFFVLACVSWGVFAVHDVLLAALGEPWWAVWRQALFALLRIGSLIVLGGVAGLGAYGVVLSWVGPVVVWVVLGSAVIAVLVRRMGRAAGALPSRAEAVSFLGPVAVSQVLVVLLRHLVPVLVTLRFGPETGAVFFIAWQAVMVLDLAAILSVDVRAAAPRRTLLVVFLPALVLVAALATPLLTMLGPEYAAADDVLRLLLLGLAIRLVVVHRLGVRQAAGGGAAWLQLLATVPVLAVAAVVPVTAGGVAALLPVAVGYIVVQVACVVAVLVFPAARRADVEVPSP